MYLGTEMDPSDTSSFSSNWNKLKKSLANEAESTGLGQSEKRSWNKQRDKGKFRVKRLKRDMEGYSARNANEGIEGSSSGNAPKLTKYLALDCEFVGVGEDGIDNMLARVSLVNALGDCVYDKFVKPTESVTDFRTAVSGVRDEDIRTGEDYSVIQKEVCEMIEGHYLVGHALKNDMKVLQLFHPKKFVRDTSRYKPFKAIARSKHPSLKKLCKLILGIRIQIGEHDSVSDARAAMQLYQLHKRQWEERLRNPRRFKHQSITAERDAVKRTTIQRNVDGNNKPGKKMLKDKYLSYRNRFKNRNK